jgi:hypothetical protein
VLAATINFGVWEEVEAFGRTFTPLLLLLPLARANRWSMVPLLALIPRASTLPISETAGIARALLPH